MNKAGGGGGGDHVCLNLEAGDEYLKGEKSYAEGTAFLGHLGGAVQLVWPALCVFYGVNGYCIPRSRGLRVISGPAVGEYVAW